MLRTGFIVILSLLSILALVLVAAVPVVMYQDHAELVSRVKTLRGERDRARTEIDEAKQSNNKLNARIHELENQRPKATSTAQTQGFPLPPPIENIRIVSQEWIPSTNPQLAYELKVVVQTNVTIHPVAVEFTCNKPIQKGSVGFAGDQVVGFFYEKTGVESDPTKFLASFGEPSFTAEKNMIVYLFSNDPIRVLSFSKVPYVFP